MPQFVKYIAIILVTASVHFGSCAAILVVLLSAGTNPFSRTAAKAPWQEQIESALQVFCQPGSFILNRLPTSTNALATDAPLILIAFHNSLLWALVLLPIIILIKRTITSGRSPRHTLITDH